MTGAERVKCAHTDCEDPVYARRYCNRHYKRLIAYGDASRGIFERHGEAGTPTYRAWANMKRRCRDVNHPTYHYYGGRGINVCAALYASYSYFKEVVGSKPKRTYTLDRIDNDGHYSCGACDECRSNGWPPNLRWATMSTQCRNRRCPVNKSGYWGVARIGKKWRASVTYQGKTHHIGMFENALAAAKAHDMAVIEHSGNLRTLNDV